MNDFDVSQFGPRTEGAPEGCLMVADRLDVVSSALIGVLSVGLVPSVDADRPCLERLAPLTAAFSSASADLRTHTLCNYASLSSAKASSVMWEMANHDLRLWVNDIMRFALTSQPPMVPHPLDTGLRRASSTGVRPDGRFVPRRRGTP